MWLGSPLKTRATWAPGGCDEAGGQNPDRATPGGAGPGRTQARTPDRSRTGRGRGTSGPNNAQQGTMWGLGGGEPGGKEERERGRGFQDAPGGPGKVSEGSERAILGCPGVLKGAWRGPGALGGVLDFCWGVFVWAVLITALHSPVQGCAALCNPVKPCTTLSTHPS